MASLIKPGSVKVLTKDGEIQVSLTVDINVNLNTEGLVLESRIKKNEDVASFEESSIKKEEKIEWEIPDFEAPSEKIDFGKKV